MTEENKYPFAIHCTVGLGRTGTLISIFAMKNYKIPASAMIAWCRMCRPGSILGGQQQYLISREKALLGMNSIYEANAHSEFTFDNDKDSVNMNRHVIICL